jgi:hypothetical protein
MENEPMNFLEFYELTEAVVLNTEKHYNDIYNVAVCNFSIQSNLLG